MAEMTQRRHDNHLHRA